MLSNIMDIFSHTSGHFIFMHEDGRVVNLIRSKIINFIMILTVRENDLKKTIIYLLLFFNYCKTKK